MRSSTGSFPSLTFESQESMTARNLLAEAKATRANSVTYGKSNSNITFSQDASTGQSSIEVNKSLNVGPIESTVGVSFASDFTFEDFRVTQSFNFDNGSVGFGMSYEDGFLVTANRTLSTQRFNGGVSMSTMTLASKPSPQLMSAGLLILIATQPESWPIIAPIARQAILSTAR